MSGGRKAIAGPIVLAGPLAGPPPPAAGTHICEVPPYLLASESALPKVAQAVKANRKLDVLVVGSRSSTIATAEAAAWPGRLEAILREKLPPVQVTINVELQPKKTSEEVAAGLPKLV